MVIFMTGEIDLWLGTFDKQDMTGITVTRKADHTTPILKHLHWLPIEARIEYKLLSSTCRSAKENMPPLYIYISLSLILSRCTTRSLRSTTRSLALLVVPRPKDVMTKRYRRIYSHSHTTLAVWPESIHPLKCSAPFHKGIRLHQCLPQTHGHPPFPLCVMPLTERSL